MVECVRNFELELPNLYSNYSYTCMLSSISGGPNFPRIIPIVEAAILPQYASKSGKVHHEKCGPFCAPLAFFPQGCWPT